MDRCARARARPIVFAGSILKHTHVCVWSCDELACLLPFHPSSSSSVAAIHLSASWCSVITAAEANPSGGPHRTLIVAGEGLLSTRYAGERRSIAVDTPTLTSGQRRPPDSGQMVPVKSANERATPDPDRWRGDVLSFSLSRGIAPFKSSSPRRDRVPRRQHRIWLGAGRLAGLPFWYATGAAIYEHFLHSARLPTARCVSHVRSTSPRTIRIDRREPIGGASFHSLYAAVLD